MTGIPFSGTAALGRHQVRRVGFGAMQLAERGSLPAPAREDAVAVLRRVIELGVDHIDTADFYGNGTANELIRAALHPYPDRLALVSKVGAQHTANGLVPAQRPEQLRADVESNLRRLGVERLAAVNIRRIDGGVGIIATGDQVVDLDDQLAELLGLRDEGKVDGIGLSNLSLDQLRSALPAGIVCVQNSYSLLERGDEPMLAECARHGIAWVPFFPLGSAFPGRAKVTDDPVVVSIAQRIGATPAQIGLAWLLAHDPHVLVIPGTSNVGHLEQNVAVGEIRLGDADVAALDAVALDAVVSESSAD